MRRIRAAVATALAILSTATAARAETYPTILVTPGPNKPIEVFHEDQAQCRDYADHFVRGDVSPAGDVLAGAAAGAAVGAVIGSAVSGRHSGGGGAAVGAVGGALAGAALGSQVAQNETAQAQRAYDDAYARCMYARENIVPGQDPTDVGPPPPPPPRP